MRTEEKRIRGFTLIELLIVIAIILILIAIALPNFLEAQIRARVASAKGQLRTLQTALEAYSTDYQTPYSPPDGLRTVPGTGLKDRYGPYPPYGVERRLRPDLSCITNYNPGCLNVLSTPIPYLTDTSAVTDPFQNPEGSPSDDTFRRPFGYYTPGLISVLGKFQVWSQQNPHRRNPAQFSNYWVYSVGPDSCSNADGDWEFCWTPDFKTGVGFSQYWEYAPTNGTKSSGDIHLIQGWGVVN